MQSLMSDESSLWLSAINTLTDLVANNPQTLHTHVDDLINRMLTLSAYAGDMVSLLRGFIVNCSLHVVSDCDCSES